MTYKRSGVGRNNDKCTKVNPNRFHLAMYTLNQIESRRKKKKKKAELEVINHFNNQVIIELATKLNFVKIKIKHKS